MEKLYNKKISIMIAFIAVMLMIFFTVLKETKDFGKEYYDYSQHGYEHKYDLKAVVSLFENDYSYRDSMFIFLIVLFFAAFMFLFTKR